MKSKRPKPLKRPVTKPAAIPTDTILDDGQLTFRVRRADGNDTDHTLDVMEAKLLCEQTESRHNLTVKDNAIIPTAEFLRDLAQQLVAIGIADCSPTLAFGIWVRVSAAMTELQKKMLGTLN